MKKDNEKDPLNEMLQGYLREELKSPEVQKAKQAFLREHFMPEPTSLSWMGVGTPTLGLLLAGIALFALVWQIAPKKIETSEASVTISRVASRTGSPMVFQKIYQDAPVTIIWVFPGGK